MALGVHEGIEHADERRALAGIILKIENLETAHARRAQEKFIFLAIEGRRQCARGAGKIAVLLQHALAGGDVAEALQIAGARHAGVLGDLRKIRIRGPLRRLVAHDGNRHAGRRGREIVAGGGRAPLRRAFVAIEHAVRAARHDGLVAAGRDDLGRDPEIVGRLQARFPEDVVATVGVEPSSVERAQVAHHGVHRSAVAAGLVGEREHDKRRVIAVLAQHCLGFGPERRAYLRGKRAPEGQLGLQVDAELVRRLEGRLRRNPGVAADVVDAVLLADAEIGQPALDVHRRETRQRKRAGLVFAAQEGRAAVDGEVAVARLELAQASRHFAPVLTGVAKD
ncbi:MAG: hypothetical protein BWX86_02271 [Verrucomicrobia bacterium ADurb.Bin122]|nr:MAG: hypothetical protein BWX86_02271 [Verrucomicrobia bacterium ADurb.Bin122]